MSELPKSSDPYTPGWIEDGLYYRGAEPPKSEEWEDNNWVYLPHENYIPISKSRVIKAMTNELGVDPESIQYEHFIKLLEGVYHFHYHTVLNELKEDYEYFSPSLGEQMREGIDRGELELRERKFLVNFIHLMIRGNFNPLKNAEYEQADQHSYLLDLPIDINWSIKDPAMYKRLFAYSETPEGQAAIESQVGVENLMKHLDLPKDFDQRIMIFHRGIEPDRTEGVFFMQKVNRAIDKLFELILKPFQKQVTQITGLKGFAPEEDPDAQSQEVADSVVFLPRWLRRTSLQDQPISVKTLFKSSTLQEPAIERVICVFRQFPPSPPPFVQKIPIVNKIMKAPEPDSTDPTIHVKLFQKIPLADLEIIFPEKHIRMKSFDKFMLIFLGFIGFVVGLAKGMDGEKGALLVIFSVLGLLAFKTVTRFINTRRRYMLQMSQDLYHKNLDNDIGVIQYLVDNIEDQEFKEAFIAYMLLQKAGRPLTEEELDGEAEEFLNRHFDGLEVDFEVDDALDKISVALNEQGEEVQTEEQRESTLFLPLVHIIESEDGETRYQAKPLKDALEAMDYRWDNFFDYN